ncbi:MAG: sugar phosphate isomerase/epimerase [Hyphomicrobiales bacterium]|nr:sugar phosphate isomerase/epimerase [Hyphomicrobiales bacterium]
MKVGCFSLIDPFSSLEHQLEVIGKKGFKYADITDNHTGASLLGEIDYTASISLDSNPADIKGLYDKFGLTITSMCSHASLLDPSAPFRYGTNEIMKGIHLASSLGVRDVVTTEGGAKTAWARGLSHRERVFTIAEKLAEPVRLAEALDVRILLEPHGIVTDSIDGMADIIEKLGRPKNVGINLDTGNSWLGGTDPVEMARTFKDLIWHIHWKDMPEEMEAQRGKIFGCGMGTIPLGQGVVDLKGVIEVLGDSVEYTTLEVAGPGVLEASYEFLKQHGAE